MTAEEAFVMVVAVSPLAIREVRNLIDAARDLVVAVIRERRGEAGGSDDEPPTVKDPIGFSRRR